jgi:putative transposase
MPRATRRHLWTGGACYHVLNRGHGRERVFHDDADRAHFLRPLRRYRDRFALSLYHYCQKGNHFHVVPRLRGNQP